MTADSRQVPTLACVPGAIAPEDRPGHFALIERLFGRAVREKVRLPNGYEFTFDATALEEVARFVALERACCPFLGFAIEVEGGAPTRLRLTGPEGVHQFLDAELRGGPSRTFHRRLSR